MAVALGLGEAWRARGSIAAADWLAYAIAAALVLAVVAASGAAAAPRRRLALGALGLIALAGWDALSLRWSATPSLARDEALLTALYAVAVLLPALSLRTELDRLVALSTVAAGVGGLAIATAIRLMEAGNPDDVYLTGRLDFPISYPNAQAALFLVGMWPALALAARRGLPIAVRGAALGCAAAAAGGWALVQSKGGALGIVVSAIVVFAVSRRRLRFAVPVALVAALNAIAFLPLTSPYRASTQHELAAIHHAGAAELVLAAAGALCGLLYAWLDHRLVVSELWGRRLGRAALLGLLVALAAGCTVFFVRVRDPGHFFSARWQSFKHQSQHESGATHLFSLGSNRYDFWRVALHEFTAHPLAGIGSRGFREAYLQHRHSFESPARAHSLELDALSETGIVGFALLLLGLGLCVAAFARRARDDLVATAGVGAFACWLAQASVDWTWTFPSVGLPLFVTLGIAAARPSAPTLSTRPRLALATACVALAVGGFGVPWLAQQYIHAALSGNGNAPADLARARSLDPLSTDPLFAQWALAPNAAAGIAPLAEALQIEPRSPDILYALGRQERLAGDRASARRTLRAALRLDPHDPAIEQELHAAGVTSP